MIFKRDSPYVTRLTKQTYLSIISEEQTYKSWIVIGELRTKTKEYISTFGQMHIFKCQWRK